MKFNRNPIVRYKNNVQKRYSKNLSNIHENISQTEKQIIELYKHEPFLAIQEFKKFYNKKNKNATQKQIREAFNRLINHD